MAKKHRKIEDGEPGRSPKSTNWSMFYEVASEYLPRSGVEREPRPDPRSNVDASDLGYGNHNDLIRGSGY